MNNRILQYLDNQMSEDERIRFEITIAESKDLQNELADARQLFAQLKEMNAVPKSDDYFAEARVRFRSNLDTKTRKAWFLRPIPVFSASASFLVLIITGFLFMRSPVTKTLETEMIEIGQEVALAYVQATPIETEMMKSEMADNSESNEAIDEALKAEIGITPENANVVLENLHLSPDELYGSLSIEDINELSKKLEN